MEAAFTVATVLIAVLGGACFVVGLAIESELRQLRGIAHKRVAEEAARHREWTSRVDAVFLALADTAEAEQRRDTEPDSIAAPPKERSDTPPPAPPPASSTDAEGSTTEEDTHVWTRTLVSAGERRNGKG